MNILLGIIHLSIFAVIGVLFIGYTLFIFPFEKMTELVHPEVKQMKTKYTPQ